MSYTTEFDTLIANVARHLGLDEDKTHDLAHALAALIFDPQHGGFAGFADRLRWQGMGSLIDSWTGGEFNEPIDAIQMHMVFGSSLLADVAQRTGVSEWLATRAMAGLMPGLVDLLTPAGKPVAELPGWLSKCGIEGWRAHLHEGDGYANTEAAVRALSRNEQRSDWSVWLLTLIAAALTTLLVVRGT